MLQFRMTALATVCALPFRINPAETPYFPTVLSDLWTEYLTEHFPAPFAAYQAKSQDLLSQVLTVIPGSPRCDALDLEIEKLRETQGNLSKHIPAHLFGRIVSKTVALTDPALNFLW
jgi:hypothetical protein